MESDRSLRGTENITDGNNQSTTVIQYTRENSNGDILTRNAIFYFAVGGNVYSLYFAYHDRYVELHSDQALYDKQLADYRNIIKSLEFIINKDSTSN